MRNKPRYLLPQYNFVFRPPPLSLLNGRRSGPLTTTHFVYIRVSN